MTTNGEIAALRVEDEDFLIASTIDRCPKTMMLRELTKNALEAASWAPAKRQIVEIGSTIFEGVPKLTIWNTGPGMSDGELRRMSDLAASIGKEKGLDANFGMGAKVASLPSNREGMRYRSCKEGAVSEVIICQRGGKYGRLLRTDENGGSLGEVIDVTEFAGEEGHDLSEDWTEVVLLGNSPDQNTVSDPYDGDPEVDGNWIATYLYHRFFTLPPDIEIRLDESTHKLDGSRVFESIPQREKKFARVETVDVGDNIFVHYFFDPPYEKSPGHNRSSVGSVASGVSVCTVVYQGEMYDLRKGREWTFDAPVFGIPFGARHISVHIEIPTDFPVLPEGYRQFLRYREGEQVQVSVNDFSDLVRENRPEWLKEVIRSFAPSTSASNDKIRDELQKLLNELRVKTDSPRASANGVTRLDQGSGRSVERSGSQSGGGGGETTTQRRNRDLSVARKGARRAKMARNQEQAPEIIELEDDELIAEKGLKGRAGRYVMETSQLFVNMKYPSIAELTSLLEQEYAHFDDSEVMRGMALNIARATIKLQVGRAVVFSLAKQLNKEWDQEDMNRALTAESLSVSADNYLDALYSVRKRMSIALKTIRQASPPQTAEVEQPATIQ